MISIVIPFKNNINTLPQTLQSIVDQISQEWECILIDDNSSDGSYNRVSEIIRDDKRFKLLEGHGGANVCRNIGLDMATHPYIVFLDADDQLKPHCLENRLDFFKKNSDCDFIISQTSVYKEDISNPRGFFKSTFAEIDDLLLAFIEHRIQWNTTAPTWKKRFLKKIGGWNENYPRLQDVELNIRALLHHPKIAFLDHKDSYYFSSPFTMNKQYYAQFGFLYLIRDYYTGIKQRYEADPVKLESFRKAFSKSLQGIISSFIKRSTWYNPHYGDILIDTIIKYPELNDNKKLSPVQFIETINLGVGQDLHAFIQEWTHCLQKEKGIIHNLRFGLGGDTLFLFYALSTGNIKVNSRFLQKTAFGLFKEIKTVQLRDKDDYWQGIAGLVHVFEILDKNELADTDIGSVLIDFDRHIVNVLSKNLDGDYLFASNILLSRLRHRSDGQSLHMKGIIVQIAEQIMKDLDLTEPINVYEKDYHTRISLLTKIYRLGLCTEPIVRQFKHLSRMFFQQFCAFPATVTVINNIFAILRWEKIMKNTRMIRQIEQILIGINYYKIHIGIAPYFRIDANYLTFLNNLIRFNAERPDTKLNRYIQERLSKDISFVLAENLNYKPINGGIIGVSGIGLSTLSYLYPTCSSWDEVLLIS